MEKHRKTVIGRAPQRNQLQPLTYRTALAEQDVGGSMTYQARSLPQLSRSHITLCRLTYSAHDDKEQLVMLQICRWDPAGRGELAKLDTFAFTDFIVRALSFSVCGCLLQFSLWGRRAYLNGAALPSPPAKTT